ncbi:MAG: LysM peptidoglycan-binding domain-containing protein [Clostridia bacterium]|nr:LysM peptidoglycan-binding domain-containing protein [Clostridia bacterium]
MDLQELNLNEMEDVTGGKGGSKKLLPQKDGYVVYQIERGDTLLKIASWYGTTVKAIQNANPTIKNANDITAGYYIYVPVK